MTLILSNKSQLTPIVLSYSSVCKIKHDMKKILATTIEGINKIPTIFRVKTIKEWLDCLRKFVCFEIGALFHSSVRTVSKKARQFQNKHTAIQDCPCLSKILHVLTFLVHCAHFCSIWKIYFWRRTTTTKIKLLLGPLSFARGQKLSDDRSCNILKYSTCLS